MKSELKNIYLDYSVENSGQNLNLQIKKLTDYLINSNLLDKDFNKLEAHIQKIKAKLELLTPEDYIIFYDKYKVHTSDSMEQYISNIENIEESLNIQDNTFDKRYFPSQYDTKETEMEDIHQFYDNNRGKIFKMEEKDSYDLEDMKKFFCNVMYSLDYEEIKQKQYDKNEEPEAIVIFGQPGSGKSFMSKDLKNMLTIDTDILRHAHPETIKMNMDMDWNERNQINPMEFQDGTQDYASFLNTLIRNQATNDKVSFIFETTGAWVYGDYLKSLKDIGFNISMNFVATPKSVSSKFIYLRQSEEELFNGLGRPVEEDFHDQSIAMLTGVEGNVKESLIYKTLKDELNIVDEINIKSRNEVIYSSKTEPNRDKKDILLSFQEEVKRDLTDKEATLIHGLARYYLSIGTLSEDNFKHLIDNIDKKQINQEESNEIFLNRQRDYVKYYPTDRQLIKQEDLQNEWAKSIENNGDYFKKNPTLAIYVTKENQKQLQEQIDNKELLLGEKTGSYYEDTNLMEEIEGKKYIKKGVAIMINGTDDIYLNPDLGKRYDLTKAKKAVNNKSFDKFGAMVYPSSAKKAKMLKVKESFVFEPSYGGKEIKGENAYLVLEDNGGIYACPEDPNTGLPLNYMEDKKSNKNKIKTYSKYNKI